VIWALCTRTIRGGRRDSETMLEHDARSHELSGGTRVFNSRMVIDACIPWERKGTFSAVVRPSEALKNKW